MPARRAMICTSVFRQEGRSLPYILIILINPFIYILNIFFTLNLTSIDILYSAVSYLLHVCVIYKRCIQHVEHNAVPL